MYSTSDLLTFVRKKLLDFRGSSDTNKQGDFWHDLEILNALNVSQQVVANFLITTKQMHHLRYLHTKTALGVGGLLTNLDEPYLHYDSCVVDNGENVKLGRIYIGGETQIYQILDHRSMCIENNRYWFNAFRRPNAQGIMYYFRQPKLITLSPASLNGEFEDWIYQDAICQHAALILGIKSIQTLRERYSQQEFYKCLGTNPEFAVLFLNNVEVTIKTNDK